MAYCGYYLSFTNIMDVSNLGKLITGINGHIYFALSAKSSESTFKKPSLHLPAVGYDTSNNASDDCSNIYLHYGTAQHLVRLSPSFSFTNLMT